MAIYRKNAGRAKRWRQTEGKKLYSSLKEVTAPSGVRYGIEFADGLYYRLRDGKRIPKSSRSTDKRSKFQYFLTEEQAAFFLARMADPELGKSQNRKSSKFVAEGEANKRAGRRLGSTLRGSRAKDTTSSRRGGSKKGGKSTKKDILSMSWGEMRKAAGSAYKVGMTKEEVIAILQTKSNPGRSRRSRGARGKISFYDLY